MRSFQASRVDAVVQPQLKKATGLFFGWRGGIDYPETQGAGGEFYYTNDQKAEMDRIVLRTNQEKRAEVFYIDHATAHTLEDGTDVPVNANAGIVNFDDLTSLASPPTVKSIVTSATSTDADDQHSFVTITLAEEVTDYFDDGAWLKLGHGDANTDKDVFNSIFQIKIDEEDEYSIHL